MEDLASKQLTNTLNEYKQALANVMETNKTLQGHYDEATGHFDQLSQNYDELEKQYDSVSNEAEASRKLLSRYKIGMLILGLVSFTYLNFTLHHLIKTDFNFKLFALLESLYFLGFIIYNFKKMPKWIVTGLGVISILTLGVYLLKQPGWEVQLNTALWALLGSLIAAFVVYILKWNK